MNLFCLNTVFNKKARSHLNLILICLQAFELVTKGYVVVLSCILLSSELGFY